MNKLSKFWSAAVAYVSLLTGSGLSIAGNVADTFRTRGPATDTLDVFLAAGAPALVILTIEMFVSPRWATTRGYQTLRWVGCLAIGVLAMAVSWLHLHELLAARGQVQAVAIFWPFAIDGMAIMATGLILSTRGKATSAPVQVTSVQAAPVATDEPIVMDVDTDTTMATVLDLTDGWTVQDQSWMDRLSSDLASDVQPVSAVPVSPAPSSNAVKAEGISEEAVTYLAAWTAAKDDGLDRPKPGEVDVLLGSYFGREPRTIRRWRTALVLNVQ